MDILKNKQTKSYDYISRYTPFYFYYHDKDDKYFYGITSNLDTLSSYVLHQVEQSDTLDYLAFKYYGRPDYFWLIADFNRIQDPFIKLSNKYKTLKIPSLSTVSWL